MKKVLIISHYFPPIGGAGVQRTVKFIKYLPIFGFQPIVLTGAGATGGRWTPCDQSLAADLPPDLIVARAISTSLPLGGSSKAKQLAERHKALVLAGSEVILKYNPQVLLATLSPFEDAAVAAELAQKFSIPWVADLRDPWALDEFQRYRSRWHRYAEESRMKDSLSTASQIILNTPEALKVFKLRFPQLAGLASVAIPNGYDKEDFSGEFDTKINKKFTIVHSGYLHAEGGLKSNVTRIADLFLGRSIRGVETLSRSHFYILKALELWLAENKNIEGQVELVLAGVLSETDRRIVHESSSRVLVRFLDYLPHKDCTRLIKSADLLFLPLHAMPAGRACTIVPGKTYEYMASGRPILGAVPDGDARDMLQSCGNGMIAGPTDVRMMLHHIKKTYSAWSGTAPVGRLSDQEYVERFERKNLTSLLASVLNKSIVS